MEFQYRAGDERRSPSPPPPTPLPLAAPSSSGSGSADAHGGDSGGLVLRQPPTPPPPVAADSADELRRQAEKAKIRERILREEAEQWELELEVRREIREELLRLSWPALGRSAAGVLAPPVAASPVGFGSGNAPLQAINHDEVACLYDVNAQLFVVAYASFCDIKAQLFVVAYARYYDVKSHDMEPWTSKRGLKLE
ncbi:hypothetical protein HU200_000537 [Digitaria exilis]|uniref:Uncharacterized protein n=1 Tax=Digitaria exilis TaxID=1010633 RepID=A0A835G1Q6_9POAL|nr:hypothetical protein HU200_000537 [Digitaria exilis]